MKVLYQYIDKSFSFLKCIKNLLKFSIERRIHGHAFYWVFHLFCSYLPWSHNLVFTLWGRNKKINIFNWNIFICLCFSWPSGWSPPTNLITKLTKVLLGVQHQFFSTDHALFVWLEKTLVQLSSSHSLQQILAHTLCKYGLVIICDVWSTLLIYRGMKSSMRNYKIW